MLGTKMRRILAGLVLGGSALALSCHGGPSSSLAGAYDPSEVVATVGSVKITRGELETAAKPKLAQMELEIWQLKSQILDSLVQRKIWEAEAAERGIQAEDLFQREVKDKVTGPSEEELTAAATQPPYASELERRLKEAKDDAAKESIEKQFREAVRQDILNKKSQTRRNEFQASLEKKFTVERNFSPPRTKIALKDEAAKGPDGAPVTIVEFSDFECPYCKRGAETMKQVTAAYPTQVRLVFKHYPLPMHAHAQKAAEAAECAREQGKFWELHDQMFANREGLEPAKLKEFAATLGLDAARFGECLDSGKMAQRVAKDRDDANNIGVGSTPTFFVNGILVSGAQPQETFKSIIDREIAGGGKSG